MNRAGVVNRVAATITLTLAAWLLAASVHGEDESPCSGILGDESLTVAALAEASRYSRTWALVYREHLTEQTASLGTLAAADLRLAVLEGGATADLARAAPGLQIRPVDGGAPSAIADLLAGTLDAALLWAPLGGLALVALDREGSLKMRNFGDSREPPMSLTAAPGTGGTKCGQAVLALLARQGLAPAETLGPLDLEDLLSIRPPPRSIAAATLGAPLYARHCARCHGPEATGGAGTRTPVNLVVSTARFSLPGFLYTVWNGRRQNGMPSFRRNLTQDELTSIYSFLRERAHGTVNAVGEPAAPASRQRRRSGE